MPERLWSGVVASRALGDGRGGLGPVGAGVVEKLVHGQRSQDHRRPGFPRFPGELLRASRRRRFGCSPTVIGEIGRVYGGQLWQRAVQQPFVTPDTESEGGEPEIGIDAIGVEGIHELVRRPAAMSTWL